MFPTVTAVICTLLFIVPGFIVETIVCRLSPIPQGKAADQLLRHVLYSTICAAFSIFYIVPLLDEKILSTNLPFFIISALVSIFLVPCLLGLLFAMAEKKDISTKIFKMLEFNPKTRIPTGWDEFAHSYLKTGVRAKVLLKTGKTVYIGFKEHDIVSTSDIDNADIYASELYTFDEYNPKPEAVWSLCKSVTGVIIPRASIDVIYVFGYEKASLVGEKTRKKGDNDNEQ